MSDKIINIREIESKVNKRGRYVTDFLTPIEMKKVRDYFSKIKGMSCIEYSMHDILFELNKILILSEDSHFYKDIFDNCDNNDDSDNCNNRDYMNSLLSNDFEICKLRIIPNKFSRELRHKDFLGSILGLGIKREKIGDIILEKNNTAVVFVDLSVASYIKQELKKIGRENVLIREVEDYEEIIPLENYVEKIVTVSSLRIDNIIAQGFNISRNESSKMFDGNLIKLNYEICTSRDKDIICSDLISVRGYGRIKVMSIQGENRHGRTRVMLRIYSSKK